MRKVWVFLLPFLGFLTITLIVGSVFAKNLQKLGFEDWDSHYSQSEFARVSLFDFGQLPLWNPYHCGGMSQIGNPQDDSINPTTWINFWLGPVVGYKLAFLFYLFIGLVGFYYLALYHKVSPLGSFVASCVFNLSLSLLTFAVGQTTFYSINIIPIAYLWHLKSLETGKFKHILLTAISLSAILFTGFIYLPQVLLFLFVGTLINLFIKKDLSLLKVFALYTLLFVGISSIKLLPALETLYRYPRYVREPLSGFSIKSLANSMLSRSQDFEGAQEWGVKTKSFLIGQNWGLEENSVYVGFLSLAIFGLGIFLAKTKRKKELVTIFIVFLILAFGLNITPSPFGFLHSLPIFNTIRVAQRYKFYFMIPFALFVGFGTQIIWKYIGKKKRVFKVLFASVILFVVLDLVIVNSALFSKSFTADHPVIKKDHNFLHVCSTPKSESEITPYSSFSDEYKGVLSNTSVSRFCFEPVPFSDHTSCFGEEYYRGEVFFLNSKNILKNYLWSPNQIVVFPENNESDLLVFNQNYDPGWRVEIDGVGKPVKNYSGLVAVDVPRLANNIKLYYLPTSFIIGSLITLLTTLAISLFLRYNREKNSQ